MLKNSKWNLRIIAWIVLYFPAALTVGRFFDYSIFGLIAAIVLGVATVMIAFPEEFVSQEDGSGIITRKPPM
jgi:hypothetical protein